MTTLGARDLDYLDHLAAESARFLAAIGTTAPDAPVPSCPGWNADDLLWHLGEVQWFWASVVREGVMTTADAEKLEAQRPHGRAALAEFCEAANRDLAAALATAPPDTPAWTWADDHTVGFIRRRQAHEALIHRIDAELTAADRTVMDPRLSADGIDEALRIMYGGDLPGWLTLTGDAERTLRIRAADTGDSWLVALGRITGSDPGTGKEYDQPGIGVAEADQGMPADATVTGTAADLDCWLWGRPAVVPPDRAGTSAVLGDFDAVIAAGVS